MNENAAEEPALQVYGLDKVEAMEVLRQVATGVLMAKIDGVERNLCHFSNTKMGTFLKVCSIFQKLKKSEGSGCRERKRMLSQMRHDLS